MFAYSELADSSDAEPGGWWFVFDLGFRGIFMPVLRFAARRAVSAYVAKRLEQTASEARQCFPSGCVMIVMH